MKRLVRYNGRTYFLNESEQPVGRASRRGGCGIRQSVLDNLMRDAFQNAKVDAEQACDYNFDSDADPDSDYAANYENELEYAGINLIGVNLLNSLIAASGCNNSRQSQFVIAADLPNHTGRQGHGVSDKIRVPYDLIVAAGVDSMYPAGSSSDFDDLAMSIWYGLTAKNRNSRLDASDFESLNDFKNLDIVLFDLVDQMSNVSPLPYDQYCEYMDSIENNLMG